MRKAFLFTLLFTIFYFSYSQSVTQLWGPVREGGTVSTSNVGVLKSMSANGMNIRTYLAFDTVNTGSYPIYTEMVEYNGNFYGMTSAGGAIDTGIIFQWNPVTNTVTKKIDFDVIKGTFPQNSLTLSNNKFYGLSGFTASGNVLFEWDPASNIYTVKATFNGAQGSNPYGNLTEYNNKLYGMTSAGGINDKGVIFEYDISSGTYTKKYDLVAATGSAPIGTLTLYNNKFYGLTRDGGPTNDGCIFEWDPSTNSYTAKYYFNNTNGSSPYSDMTYYNNKFYGITYQGGANNAGVIFEWDQTLNIYTKKFDMDSAGGRYSSSKLKLIGNKFYGFTTSGGANNLGVIFEWDPATNTYTKKVDLNSVNGSNPNGSLTTWGTKFVGLTTNGGIYNRGTIIEWDPATNIYTKRHDFAGFAMIKGAFPLNGLTFYNGKLYGATSFGGLYNAGTIYEYDPQIKSLVKKFDFDNTNGSRPISKLTLKNGKFYGATLIGGSNNGGVLFEWDPATNGFSKKYDFTSANGLNPSGNLVENGGKFYGTTRIGGSSNLGVIYEWDPASNIYTKKIDLTAATGNQPNGSLTFYNNLFYGVTIAGGANNAGVIFQWDPATNVFTKKYDLAVANGSAPRGTLTLYNNKFYGLTRDGGPTNDGCIFEWDPSNNGYTKKFDFSSATGANPQGSLMLSNGKLYGMTLNGGSGLKGVIFEWDPALNAYSVKQEFISFDDGQSPSFENNFIEIPAPIAAGTPNACTGVPSITIDATNNNTWVPIVDNDGNVLAEINANGNSLGVVSASFYINDGTVREDANHTLYLDRNFTITPQVQPTTPVDIRLYMTEAEFQALKNATNSLGQPSGVNTITDVQIFKNNDACVPAVSGVLNPVPINAGVSYSGYGYLLTASISSFSSFYIMTPPAALSIHVTDFSGQLVNDDVKLKWKAFTSQDVTSFAIERSTNGRDFSDISTVRSVNSGNAESYNFTDANASAVGSPVLFYRLAERSNIGSHEYSRIIAINILKANTGISIYPNPVNGQGTLQFSLSDAQNISWKISDITGKTVVKGAQHFSSGKSSISFNTTGFPSGVYIVQLQGTNINEKIKMIKKN